jgi:hypothetical protein
VRPQLDTLGKIPESVEAVQMRLKDGDGGIELISDVEHSRRIG